MNLDPITATFRKGMHARTAGRPLTDNPYPHSREYGKDWHRREWEEGWHQEDKAIRDKLDTLKGKQ